MPVSHRVVEVFPPTSILWLPAVCLMYSRHSASRDAIVYRKWQPASDRKLRIIAFPCVVRSTSGWNCTPYNRRSTSAIAVGKPCKKCIYYYIYNCKAIIRNAEFF